MHKQAAIRHWSYLREMVKQAGRALGKNDYDDLAEILNEIDGTSALLREYLEERQ